MIDAKVYKSMTIFLPPVTLDLTGKTDIGSKELKYCEVGTVHGIVGIHQQRVQPRWVVKGLGTFQRGVRY